MMDGRNIHQARLPTLPLQGAGAYIYLVERDHAPIVQFQEQERCPSLNERGATEPRPATTDLFRLLATYPDLHKELSH
jgi:hypothetical protein